MNLSFDTDELRPLVEAIVRQTVDQLHGDGQLAGAGRLAYLEQEAAGLLGVRTNVLRDARLRGEIVATKVGGRIAYERGELERYLRSQREDVADRRLSA